MKTPRRHLVRRTYSLAGVICLVAAVMIGIAGAQAPDTDPAMLSSKFYTVHNLVSDGFVPADHVDPDLVNPWGITASSTSPMWVADNETGKSTIYNGAGVKQSTVVIIPPPPGSDPPGHPTGIVSNSGSDFVVTNGSASGPSRFIFATEDGTIAGWAPNVDPTHAIIAVDNSASGAIYKGLALGGNGSQHFLYAADFFHQRIDVFDSSFHPVTVPGGFLDPRIPERYAPFGVQNILGNIYVTYARRDEEGEDDVPGPGRGFVNVFDANGNRIHRFASRGALNAPWGVALAPADFGKFSGTVLIGNFGDGRINAYDLVTHDFRGQLASAPMTPIEIEGLWGIAFGNGVAGQPINTLFFAAGPGDEEHGLYGRIDPAP